MPGFLAVIVFLSARSCLSFTTGSLQTTAKRSCVSRHCSSVHMAIPGVESQHGWSKPGPSWEGPTGTSFLPEDTVERAAAGNKVEKGKLKLDPTTAFNNVYEFASAIRAGELNWEDVEKFQMDTTMKWVGLVHRSKRTPGRFMMRLRTPNGIVTSDLMRFYADCVEPYGPEIGVIDITTRQNIQLRGVALEDADKIIDGLHARGQTSLQSALDNVRNLVGSPLAGIDPLEMVDTREICTVLNDLITVNKETGERGNPVWGNLPRKFNIAVSGGRDDFAHTHINDIGLQPCEHAETGEMGFNVVLGGYMSTKRVAESIDMDVWIPATAEAAETLSTAILRIFRDEGNRKDRQKARLMWLIEDYGEVTEVDGHLRCAPAYRDKVLAEMDSYGKDIKHDHQQPRPTTPYERRELLGVHPQKQEDKSRVGIHVPVGRLSAEETRQLADLAEKYSAGEVRFTVEQNVILPNVDNDKLVELRAEPAFGPDSRFSIDPGHIVGNVVSCTGSQFCGFAIVETKQNAEETAKILEDYVEVPRAIRIHWTGCPNSCGQVQAADIGLMGAPARKVLEEGGKPKAVPGCNIFVGGQIGEKGGLSLDPHTKGIPLDSEDLIPTLAQIIVDEFGGKIRSDKVEAHEAYMAKVAA